MSGLCATTRDCGEGRAWLLRSTLQNTSLLLRCVWRLGRSNAYPAKPVACGVVSVLADARFLNSRKCRFGTRLAPVL